MIIEDGILKQLEESDLGKSQEKNYHGEKIKITVPEGVTAIAEGVFKGLCNIDEIILPQSLKSIGCSAFERCWIKKIDIPSNVKRIGAGAFFECRTLKQISLPKGLEEIGKSAFELCYQLPDIRIPHTVKTLGQSAFYECEHLKHAVFEKDEEGKSTLTEIPGLCFGNCKLLEEFILPEGIKRIDSFVLDRCENIRKIELPSTLEEIGKNAWGEAFGWRENKFFYLRYLNIKTENPAIVKYMARLYF